MISRNFRLIYEQKIIDKPPGQTYNKGMQTYAKVCKNRKNNKEAVMENKEYYTSGECAKALGVTKDPIRRWDKKGILKPTYIVPNTGWRMYTEFFPSFHSLRITFVSLFQTKCDTHKYTKTMNIYTYCRTRQIFYNIIDTRATVKKENYL